MEEENPSLGRKNLSPLTTCQKSPLGKIVAVHKVTMNHLQTQAPTCAWALQALAGNRLHQALSLPSLPKTLH